MVVKTFVTLRRPLSLSPSSRKEKDKNMKLRISHAWAAEKPKRVKENWFRAKRTSQIGETQRQRERGKKEEDVLRNEMLGVREVHLGRMWKAREIRLQKNPGRPAVSLPWMARHQQQQFYCPCFSILFHLYYSLIVFQLLLFYF